MKFLNINTENYKSKNDSGKIPINELNTHIKRGDNVFILFYMIGCGPCNEARPEWTKIQNILHPKYEDKENYIVVDIDQNLMHEIKDLDDTPNAFPTIRHIKGKKYKDYERERNIDAFIDWIEGEMKQNGGKKKTRRARSKRKRVKSKRRRY